MKNPFTIRILTTLLMILITPPWFILRCFKKRAKVQESGETNPIEK